MTKDEIIHRKRNADGTKLYEKMFRLDHSKRNKNEKVLLRSNIFFTSGKTQKFDVMFFCQGRGKQVIFTLLKGI